MKKFNEKMMAIVSHLCVAVLALLGFSCSDSNGYLCMYGTPSGDFEAKGLVTNEEGSPVEDAEVRVTYPEISSDKYSFASVKTNSGGDYALKGESTGIKEVKVVCVPPGDLEPDSVIVTLNYDKKGSDGWYIGKASFTADFKLKKQQ